MSRRATDGIMSYYQVEGLRPTASRPMNMAATLNGFGRPKRNGRKPYKGGGGRAPLETPSARGALPPRPPSKNAGLRMIWGLRFGSPAPLAMNGSGVTPSRSSVASLLHTRGVRAAGRAFVPRLFRPAFSATSRAAGPLRFACCPRPLRACAPAAGFAGPGPAPSARRFAPPGPGPGASPPSSVRPPSALFFPGLPACSRRPAACFGIRSAVGSLFGRPCCASPCCAAAGFAGSPPPRPLRGFGPGWLRPRGPWGPSLRFGPLFRPRPPGPFLLGLRPALWVRVLQCCGDCWALPCAPPVPAAPAGGSGEPGARLGGLRPPLRGCCFSQPSPAAPPGCERPGVRFLGPGSQS